jgi:hypothetical protein
MIRTTMHMETKQLAVKHTSYPVALMYVYNTTQFVCFHNVTGHDMNKGKHGHVCAKRPARP